MLFSNYVIASRYANKDFPSWNHLINGICKKHKELKGVEFDNFEKKLMKDKVVFPSMRSLQYINGLHRNERMYNCAASIADRIENISNAFYLSLCGCGVGMNICKRHVEKLPKLVMPEKSDEVYIIPDNVRGWGNAFHKLLNSFVIGRKVKFDFSQISPKGTILRSCGKPAPGPEILARCLKQVEERLHFVVKSQSGRLKPIDVFDIICMMAQCVISGGVRRSALIFGFDKDDVDMLNAKVGNEWLKKHPYRVFANISVIVPKKEVVHCKKFIKDMFNNALVFGEPGILLIDYDQMVNPCAEIVFRPWIDNVSGFQFCNLSEINMANITSLREFEHAAKLAVKLGTVQASYTEFELDDVSKAITERDRLLGVSLTGWMSRKYDPSEKDFAKVTELCKQVNEFYTRILGINKCARMFTVKPSGTVSSVAETSPGIHPWLYKDIVRFVQEAEGSKLLQWYESIGGKPKYIKEYNNYVCGFYLQGNHNNWERSGMLEEMVKDMLFINQNWIRKNNLSNFTNSISCTFLCSNSNDVDYLVEAMFANLEDYPVGTTVLSKYDSDYPYLPYTKYNEDNEDHRYIKELCLRYSNESSLQNLHQKFMEIHGTSERLGLSNNMEELFCDSEGCVLKSVK